MRLVILFAVRGLIIFPEHAHCQTTSSTVTVSIPEIALLDIETTGGGNITFNVAGPAEAGDGLVFTSNTSCWLNFTSCVTATGNRKIVAQISNGILPAGLSLSVQVSSVNISGAGVCGNPSGTVNLDATAKNLVTGIGGCYTGDGPGSGLRLTYNLTCTTYSDLRSGSYGPLELTYTIVAY